MAFKDLLLQISSYPEASPESVIAQGVEFAAALQAEITALAFEYTMDVPYSPMDGMFLNVAGMVAAETQKSLVNAKAALKSFQTMALERGVMHGQIIERCSSRMLPDAVTDHARLRDLTLIPARGMGDFQQSVAEKVIFESGRPVVILPEPPATATVKPRSLSLERVGIAWDFSRPAARAVADAMPILIQAEVVRVVIVSNEKTIATRRSLADLERHLGLHGIDVAVDDENDAGRSIGETLAQYADAFTLDLLVMGAYGHSRFRDFLLGGATQSMTASPALPIFLSH